MPNGLAGKWMRFAKGSTPVKITRCRSNLRTQFVETTNAESGPNASGGNVAEEFVAGVNGGDVDIDIVYQISDGVYTLLADGGSYTVTIYPDKSTAGAIAGNSTLITGTLSVESFEFTGEVKGLYTARVSGKFNGGRTVAGL